MHKLKPYMGRIPFYWAPTDLIVPDQHDSDDETEPGELGSLSEKKYGIFWEFFPNVGPLPPPPQFGRPPFKKKLRVYFAF